MFGSDLKLGHINRDNQKLMYMVYVYTHTYIHTNMYTYIQMTFVYIQQICIQDIYIDSRYRGIIDLYIEIPVSVYLHTHTHIYIYLICVCVCV